MKDVGNLRSQILDELMNMKSLFLSEVKIFKNEFLQSFVKHIPSEKVHAILRVKHWRGLQTIYLEEQYRFEGNNLETKTRS